MYYDCDFTDPWHQGDFVPCFREIVLDGWLLILAGSGSLVALLLWLYHQRQSTLQTYTPLKNDPPTYGAAVAASLPDGDINYDACSSTSSNSTVMGGHSSPRWTVCCLAKIILSSAQWTLCVTALWLLYVGRFPLDKQVEQSLETQLWVYTIRSAFWVYVLALALFSARFFRPGMTLRKSLPTRASLHADGLVLLAFGMNFIDLRSYFLVHDVRLAGPGYILTLGSTGVTAALFVVILLEKRHTQPEPKISDTGRILSGEKWASLYSQFMFNWVGGMMKKGFRDMLNENDLLELPPENRAQKVVRHYRKSRSSSMAWSLFLTFRWPLVRQFMFCIVCSVFLFGPPYYLHKIIQFTENRDPDHRVSVATAFLYVLGLFFTSSIQSLAYQQALYIGRELSTRTLSIVIGEVYEKALRRRGEHCLPSAGTDPKAMGHNVNNLLSVDAQKLSELAAYGFLIYSIPLQISICVWSLYQLLGTASIYMVLVMTLAQPVTILLSHQYQKRHQAVMACTDARIRLMSEFLAGIRIVKFFAWEKEFQQRVNNTRESELKAIRARLFMYMWMGNTWFLIPMLTMVTVFFVYTRTAILTASTAFTALALFNTFKNIFEQLPNITSYVLQANVSIRRIEKFLAEPEVELPPMLSPNANAIYLGFTGRASFGWEPLPAGKPVLHDLCLSFPPHQLSIVCGPVGSGKTTLLASLLGETYCMAGSAILPRRTSYRPDVVSGVAYVAQQAWLQNASIKENILFGLPYDADRYARVLYMTALTRDLDVLQYGDSTEVGEKGIALSGGQMQRVSIARAVYSQAETVILDDCLSAVDAHTAEHLYNHCLTGDFMKHRTVILVTHHVSLCFPHAAYMVVLQDGRVIKAGNPSDVVQTGILGDNIGPLDKEQAKQGTKTTAETVATTVPKLTKVSHLDGKGKLTRKETRAKGSVSMIVYNTYCQASGGYLFWVFVLLLFCLTQAAVLGQDYWIKIWSSAYTRIDGATVWLMSSASVFASQDLPLWAAPRSFGPTAAVVPTAPSVNVNYYIGVYLFIGILSLLMLTLRSTVLFLGSLQASRRLHAQLLDRILHAKMRFFDTTPVGRIINRFSSDIDTIDRSVAPSLTSFLNAVVATIYVVCLVTAVTPVFVIPGTLIALLFWVVARYYIRTSRDLKRLNSVARSPIYVHFGESVQGVATIRAYGCQGRFIQDIFTKVDDSNRPFLWMWAANRWLNCRVDLLGAFVGLFTGVALILSRSWLDPSLAGLSLSYALSFTHHVLWIVRMYAVNDMNANSIERVREYIDIDQEPPRHIPERALRPTWPETGALQVEDLVMKYSPDDPPALNGLSFTTRPLEKIGIVGRTGCGKSTLALSLFRFMEAHHGRILIDGVDIHTVGLEDLRSRLTIIPQDPVLFSGTLRSNLDPFAEHSDKTLWEALQRVHLKEHDGEQGKTITLDTVVTENGSNWSQGQRQLIALARALVKKSALIVLDEATSSVDFDTDHRIQQAIRSEFAGSSLLCIAHRIRTVADYDRILVLDQGQVLEFDTPYALMTRHNGTFRQMCERSGEFKELLAVAQAKQLKTTQ